MGARRFVDFVMLWLINVTLEMEFRNSRVVLLCDTETTEKNYLNFKFTVWFIYGAQKARDIGTQQFLEN